MAFWNRKRKKKKEEELPASGEGQQEPGRVLSKEEEAAELFGEIESHRAVREVDPVFDVDVQIVKASFDKPDLLTEASRIAARQRRADNHASPRISLARFISAVTLASSTGS